MPEIGLFGSEGGATDTRRPYPICRQSGGASLTREEAKRDASLTRGGKAGTLRLVRLRVRTNSGVEVPIGRSTGCP